MTTLPASTIAAFEDHGRLQRTVDTDLDHAQHVVRRLAAAGIDMEQVGAPLESEGIASFHESFQGVLRALDTKARQVASH